MVAKKREKPAANRGVAIELCSGMGGIGLGLRELGFHVAKAYDSWADAVAVYNHNSPDKVAETCNILSDQALRLARSDRKSIGEIELLAAGPPCKGFSQLRNGRHDGRNGHNRVLAAMPTFVSIYRPRLFLIENVPDLLRHRDGKTFASLIEKLSRPANRLRYRIEFKIYDAAAFGTPQARRRLLLLGVRNDAGEEHLPEPELELTQLFTAVRHHGKIDPGFQKYLAALKDPNNSQIVSAHQALSDLPSLGPGQPERERPYASAPTSAFQRWARKGASGRLHNTQTPNVNAETLKRLRHIPAGGCARSIPEQHLNGLARRYDSAYRRLHPDSPSTALSTKYDCVYHYSRHRSLSVREYARLQGIPDRFSFPAHLASRRSAYEMIGNSVPPLLIERVLGSALDPEVI